MTGERQALEAILKAWDGGEVSWFKDCYKVMEDGRRALAASQAERPAVKEDK